MVDLLTTYLNVKTTSKHAMQIKDHLTLQHQNVGPSCEMKDTPRGTNGEQAKFGRENVVSDVKKDRLCNTSGECR